MLNKEGLEKKIIKGSNEMIFYYADKLRNSIFEDDVLLCKSEMEKYKNVYYNYEESSSILAVHYINNLLSIFHNGGDILNNKYAAKLSICDYDDELLNFIVRKLLALKNLSRDTLTDTFNTRTYLENEIELQRMITVFNYLTNLMDKVYESRIKRQNKITEIINKETKHNKSFLDLPTFSRNYEIQ